MHSPAKQHPTRTSFEVLHLKTVTDGQVEEISDLCLRAFHEDITHKAMLGGDWSLQPAFCRAVTRATALDGELYIVKVGNEIVSTASWFGPDSFLFATPEQRALGYDDVFDKLSPEAKYWNNHTYPDVVGKLEADEFTDEERLKCWWLYNLATKPGHEGNGYATALIDTLYDKVKEDGMFLGVAPGTAKNVEKYGAMGFRKRGGRELPAPTGGFYVQVMTREADRNRS